LATDVAYQDVPIPPGEEWYYELGGRTHGPLRRSDLEDLLNRAGETAGEVRVRQGSDGPWKPFQTPATAAAPQHSGGDAAPSSHRSPAAGQPRSTGGLRELMHAHWDVGAALGAWILLNVAFLSFWPQPYSRERDYLHTLEAINTEVQDLRQKPATEAEWGQFGQRTRVVLEPMIKDLKKSASAAEPVRQQLLWAARDVIPRTFGPRNKERDEQDRMARQYLDGVQRQLDDR
jgi:hypothetical protein